MVPPATAPLPLAERLRPKRLGELIGNARARTELRGWAERWRSGELPGRRAAILAGPPGVGKTTAALALAAEMDWSVVEMNASDARNQSAIDRVAGRASVSHSLGDVGEDGSPRRALILLDEADCLTGRVVEPSRAIAEPVALREFLRGRYATVEALNVAWGLVAGSKVKPFSDWSAIPRSPGNFGWGRLASSRRDLEEWRASGRPVDTSDRGGLGAIARLVRSTRQPLVLTVNDDRSLNRYSAVFRTAALRIRFYPIRPDELSSHLVRVIRAERLAVTPAAVPAIVARAQGDLRAALNDLDAISYLPAGPGQLEVLGARDRTADFAGLTAEALTSARFYRAGEVMDRLDAPPDDLLPWIEENIVHFAPDAARRDAAFATLVVAERFLMRATRARTYGLWSYASELLTGGVGLALRDRPVPIGAEAAFPRFLAAMGQSRAAREVRESLARKLAARFHLSREKVRSTLLPELEGLTRHPRGRRGSRREVELGRAIAHELALSAPEASFLFGVSVDDPEFEELLGTEEDDAESGGPPTREGESEPPTARESRPATEPDAARKRVQRSLSEFGA
jgi:DNA polymerase III delta prime subunit